MKIKHNCRDCAEKSKWYAGLSKWCDKRAKEYAEKSKWCAKKCRCEK